MPIKLNPTAVEAIRTRELPPRTDRTERGAAVRALAAEFSVAIETVRRIRTGMTWNRAFPRAKITPESLANIISRPSEKAETLAVEHGIDASTVYRIRARETLYARDYIAVP